MRESVRDMTNKYVDPEPESHILGVGVGSASLIFVGCNSPVDPVQPGSENWYNICMKLIMWTE